MICEKHSATKEAAIACPLCDDESIDAATRRRDFIEHASIALLSADAQANQADVTERMVQHAVAAARMLWDELQKEAQECSAEPK